MARRGLIVDRALVAAVGRWKTTKSCGLLEVCIAIATGRPAFGRHPVPNPGPVLFVNEESGRAALWRRLDALCRGRAIDPEELRGLLHVAADARIRLDDPEWQARLIEHGQQVRPRLFVFDPLARMKGSARDENVQREMGPVIEFLRLVRDETGAAVCFVQHAGHQGEHMRGTSDLESVWETLLRWKRDGQSPLVDVESEHREAEAGEPLRYRIAWNHDTRSMRLDAIAEDTGPTLADRILEHLREQGPGTTDEVREGVAVRRPDVLRTLEQLEQAGTVHRGPSERRDAMGRPIRGNVWKPGQAAETQLIVNRPEAGTEQDDPRSGHRGPSHRPPSLEGDGTDGPPDGQANRDADETERLADLARTAIAEHGTLAPLDDRYLDSVYADLLDRGAE